MVTCGQRKMMPMATASVVTMSSSSTVKPKIGFSIDSIVGSTSLRNHVIESSLSPRSEISERISSPLSDCSYPLELRNSTESSRNFRFPNDYAQLDSFRKNASSKRLEEVNFDLEQSCFEKNNQSSPRSTVPDDPGGKHSDRPLSPHMTPSNPPTNKGPIVVPGIPAGLIRPFPLQAPNICDTKAMPPFLGSREIAGATNPHFLAAQFQMAAALAHGHQSGQVFPPNSGLPSVMHHPQFVGGANMVRDSYPLYPWLLSRHGRIFPHRFPGNFLLQPFRKPKRVRTAFSPSQLLKLEHAFENNHYVVGAERKTLAQALNLTETQVKVWFQNRRTKHKRMQQEENSKGGSGNSDNSNSDGRKIGESNGSSRTSYEDEDPEEELIDMDDCLSDPEEGDLVPR